MSVFGNYALYYDLLYQDKNYSGEVDFIHRLISDNSYDAKSILELGCGTASHAILLAEKGYQIYGIDFSLDMLQLANSRVASLPAEISSRLRFTQGDVRNVRVNEKFDVVTSLFHVVSYQTTNSDLIDTFTTVREHLKPAGIFIFDVWYGPAVLSDHPVVRVKRLQNEKVEITRIAEPVLHPNQNLVDVNYQIMVQNRITGEVESIHESHRMRYLFQTEIDMLLQQAQMELIASGEWMTSKELGFNTWSAYFVGRGK
jgi:SAM-dependent methyltransferase